MNYILEEMNKVDADGVDFIPAFYNGDIPPIICSYTKEELQHTNYFPKAARRYWKMINSEKRYIDKK